MSSCTSNKKKINLKGDDNGTSHLFMHNSDLIFISSFIRTGSIKGVAHGNIPLDVHILNAGLQLNAARTQKLPSSKASLLTLTREPRLASANLVGSHALLQSLCIMGESSVMTFVMY